MALHTVTWTIDIDADTPEAAAKLARDIQQDPNSIATVFEVTGDDIRPTLVDLTDYSNDEDERHPDDF